MINFIKNYFKKRRLNMLAEQELTKKDFDILLEAVTLWELQGRSELYTLEATKDTKELAGMSMANVPQEYQDMLQNKIKEVKAQLIVKRDISIILRAKLLQKKVSIDSTDAMDKLNNGCDQKHLDKLDEENPI